MQLRRSCLVWTFFFLEITFCGLTSTSSIRNRGDQHDEINRLSELVGAEYHQRVYRDAPVASSDNSLTNISSTKTLLQSVISNSNGSHSNSNDTVNWPKDKDPTIKGDGSVAAAVLKLNNSSVADDKNTFLLPSKNPDLNYDPSKKPVSSSEEELSLLPEHSGSGGKGQSTTLDYAGTQPQFDEKAIQRAIMVVAGLAALILVYLGLKFVFLKKRPVTSNRYGRIESEMDLLDEMEEDVDSEEEDDTLFDVNATRRSQF